MKLIFDENYTGYLCKIEYKSDIILIIEIRFGTPAVSPN